MVPIPGTGVGAWGPGTRPHACCKPRRCELRRWDSPNFAKVRYPPGKVPPSICECVGALLLACAWSLSARTPDVPRVGVVPPPSTPPPRIGGECPSVSPSPALTKFPPYNKSPGQRLRVAVVAVCNVPLVRKKTLYRENLTKRNYRNYCLCITHKGGLTHVVLVGL